MAVYRSFESRFSPVGRLRAPHPYLYLNTSVDNTVIILQGIAHASWPD